MSDAQARLNQVTDMLTSDKTASSIPFDPNCTKFPARNDVPKRSDAPPDAAWVWGEDDQVDPFVSFHGSLLNMALAWTPQSRYPSQSESCGGRDQDGRDHFIEASNHADWFPSVARTNVISLPLNVPEVPAFHRETFKHEIKDLAHGLAFDDLYTHNTQSGTQWDGFRHVAHFATGTFYNNTHTADIIGPEANLKCSIHHWSEHGGIAGRGILLDYRAYADKKGIQYDSFMDHRIPYDELYSCGKDQGIDIRPQAQGGDIRVGDILFVRSGFISQYHKVKSSEEWSKVALRPHALGPEDQQRWAGVAQEEKMIDWLHDCYFAAVGGDSPSFEAWPTNQEYYLHEYLLAMWGCPIGEMIDLEKLAKRCHETNRWTFFVTSSPNNMPGGISTNANAMAIF